MSEQLPKFEDLTPQQVDDLVATGIMGWSIMLFNPPPEHRKVYIKPDNSFGGARLEDVIGDPVFSPYHDLNDCHLAEEKLLEAMKAQTKLHGGGDFAIWLYYIEELSEITGAELQFISENIKEGSWDLIFATPQQKCKALLLAKGLVR